MAHPRPPPFSTVRYALRRSDDGRYFTIGMDGMGFSEFPAWTVKTLTEARGWRDHVLTSHEGPPFWLDIEPVTLVSYARTALHEDAAVSGRLAGMLRLLPREHGLDMVAMVEDGMRGDTGWAAMRYAILCAEAPCASDRQLLANVAHVITLDRALLAEDDAALAVVRMQDQLDLRVIWDFEAQHALLAVTDDRGDSGGPSLRHRHRAGLRQAA